MRTKGYTMKNTDKDYNYFLEKKNFDVSELHMGYDCKLQSITRQRHADKIGLNTNCEIMLMTMY